MNNKWHILYVKTGNEYHAFEKLKKIKAIRKIIIPRRVLYERKNGKFNYVEKVLFPGYIFFNAKIDEKLYSNLKQNYYFFKLMNTVQIESNEIKVVPVDYEEVIWLFSLMDSTGLIKVFNGTRLENEFIPHDNFLRKNNFRIIRVNWRKKRVKVQFQIFGEYKELDLSINIVHR